ncbi:MAG TPA: hypothetical protein VJS13_10265 [Pyrinomonadaceae bacterium]|nr:hypothetical protein [Pyrinomonadaceae bacterium]
MKNKPSRIVIAGLSLLLFVAGMVHGQSESIFKRLSGSWIGEGKTMGMPATMRMSWDWVLGDKFLRLSLQNEMRGENGQVQLFEGHAYYQPSEGKCEGTWFDSRGVSFPIKCSVEGRALTALWGSTSTEQGKSVYRLTGDGKLEVVDFVKQPDGNWREFGRFVVSRTANN